MIEAKWIGLASPAGHPGYLGAKRSELEQSWTAKYGEKDMGWRYRWQTRDKSILDFPEVFQIYIDGYIKYFQEHSDEAERIRREYSFGYDLDNQITQEQAFNPYALYNVPGIRNQFHHVAFNIAIQTVTGKYFQGEKPLQVREGPPGTLDELQPEGYRWSPGRIPCATPDIIPDVQLDGLQWWSKDSIEDFYQRAKIIQVRRDRVRKDGFQEQLTLLKQYGSGIDWRRQGKGFLSLARELYHGESVLRYLPSDESKEIEFPEGLLREVSIAAVYVYYQQPDGRRLQLTESIQLHKNGTINRRDFGWVSEKSLPHETPRDTAKRAVREELGLSIENREQRLRYIRDVIKQETKTAYPSLVSRVTAHDFSIDISDEEYESNLITLPNGEIVHGFKEVQPDKTTYFTWRGV